MFEYDGVSSLLSQTTPEVIDLCFSDDDGDDLVLSPIKPKIEHFKKKQRGSSIGDPLEII